MPYSTAETPSLRRGSRGIAAVVVLTTAVAAGCMLGDGISPQRLRRYGAAIDEVLAVSIDAWLGVDTLTIQGPPREHWFLFNALVEYGLRDFSYHEPEIGLGEHHVARR